MVYGFFFIFRMFFVILRLYKKNFFRVFFSVFKILCLIFGIYLDEDGEIEIYFFFFSFVVFY